MSLIDGFDSLSFSVDGVVTKVVLMCVDVALKKALDFFSKNIVVGDTSSIFGSKLCIDKLLDIFLHFIRAQKSFN